MDCKTTISPEIHARQKDKLRKEAEREIYWSAGLFASFQYDVI